MKFTLKEKLQGDDPLIGTILTLPSTEVAEIISSLGYDWVFIDAEHSALDVSQVGLLLQAIAPGCSGVVRVPAQDEVWIKKVLDLGVEGIIVPNVKTAAEVKNIVEMCHYPPAGTRSVGIARAHTYGLTFGQYMKTANDDLTVIIQLEHREAFENIDEILKVPGFDAVFIGPYDYSASVGKTGQLEDGEVQREIARINGKCRRRKIPVGIFGMNARAVKEYVLQGYMLITAGIDFLFLKETAEETLRSLRSRTY
ncbi:MAG TPA: 2,4-dihydroxyhept-2-ene-1,7-dioic acid aldolase [Bacteroidetes bacterium]|nr:2,4-dihydroxyhept-2-ene-1,7-dioic acid aldolase [Bacteroidota bacterium]